jgi:hypothetical protein
VLQSIYEKTLESTLDIYSVSEVRFDIYELTPVFFIGPVANSTENVQDLDGQRVDGTSSIVLYTIHRPRIHDLVVFTHPVESEEIFRVTNIRLATNMVHSKTPVEWFEADLGYAPVKDLKSLKIETRYVYDLSDEKNILYTEYVDKIQWLNEASSILEELKRFYNIREDVYEFDGFIPVITNEIISLFKRKFHNNWNRLFEAIPIPYGYRHFVEPKYNDLNEIFYDENNVGYELVGLSNSESIIYTYGIDETMDMVIDLSWKLYNLATGKSWISNK